MSIIITTSNSCMRPRKTIDTTLIHRISLSIHNWLIYTLIKNDCDFSLSLSSHLTRFINWKHRWERGIRHLFSHQTRTRTKEVTLSLNDRKLPMRIVCSLVFFSILSQIIKDQSWREKNFQQRGEQLNHSLTSPSVSQWKVPSLFVSTMPMSPSMLLSQD